MWGISWKAELTINSSRKILHHGSLTICCNFKCKLGRQKHLFYKTADLPLPCPHFGHWLHFHSVMQGLTVDMLYIICSLTPQSVKNIKFSRRLSAMKSFQSICHTNNEWNSNSGDQQGIIKWVVQNSQIANCNMGGCVMPLIVTFMEFLAGFCFPLGVRVCMFVYKKNPIYSYTCRWRQSSYYKFYFISISDNLGNYNPSQNSYTFHWK